MRTDAIRTGTVKNFAKLTSKKDDQTVPLEGMEISFFVQGAKDKVQLGKASTDEAGKAAFTLPDKLDVPRNKEGKYLYSATYAGSKEYQGSESSAEIMELVKKINMRGTAVLMATHNYELVRKYPARVIQLKDGKLIDIEIK